MKSKKEKKTKEVAEPQADYGSNKLVFFNSFEESAADNYKWLATLTPEQHLAHAVTLISRLYTKELKNKPEIGNDFKIIS